MDPFMTIEVTSWDEFDALIDVVWKAHYNPYDPAFSAFFPIFGPTAADREAAIQAGRMYCNELLRLCHAPKHQWMNRPHLGTSKSHTDFEITKMAAVD